MFQEEKQLISEILRLLDDKYASDFKYWWRILAALKLYSNTKEMFEIFIEFSERCSEKFNYESCQWSWKNTNVNGITIQKLYNYLLETIEIYKSDGCNNEKIEEITKKLSKFHILTKKDVSIRLNQKFWDSKKKSKFMSKINRKNNNNYSSK